MLTRNPIRHSGNEASVGKATVMSYRDRGFEHHNSLANACVLIICNFTKARDPLSSICLRLTL